MERAERAWQDSRDTCGEIAKVCTVRSPPSHAPLRVAGRGRGWGAISLLLWQRVCRGNPPPPPSPLPPPPPAPLGGGGGGFGGGGLSVYSSGSEFAEAPPTPAPSPPLRGGR